MLNSFSFYQFFARFPNDNSCLEGIINQRFSEGIFCNKCKKTTRHYKLKRGKIYACKFCRTQIAPLAGTLFEKSTTPLHLWFFALFLMTQTRGDLSAKQLQRELGVTYKTAWRMKTNIQELMRQNNGDLLRNPFEPEHPKEHRWVFFNKLEISWVEKQEPKDES